MTSKPAPPIVDHALAKGYGWLGSVGTLPLMVQHGLALHGTLEVKGTKNNPTIMAWAEETGLEHVYTADAVPWCGLFMAVVAKRAGYDFPPHPLWALNWAGFGGKSLQPCLGDVLIFVREGGGHVAIYCAEDNESYHVLGGNQSDAVSITRIKKDRLKAARSPLFKIGRPLSSRPYIVSSKGTLSINEA